MRLYSIKNFLKKCFVFQEYFPSCCTRVLRLLRNSVRFAEAIDVNEDLSNTFIGHNLFEDFTEAVFEFQRRKQMKPKCAILLLHHYM